MAYTHGKCEGRQSRGAPPSPRIREARTDVYQCTIGKPGTGERKYGILSALRLPI